MARRCSRASLIAAVSAVLVEQHRLPTPMHDPVYRIGVATENVGYDQPPQPGFYLGEGMKPPPRPPITIPAARGRPR